MFILNFLMLKYFSFTVLVGSLNKSISLILFVRKSMYLMCNYKLYNNFIAFSRIERTHPNSFSQAREIEIFCQATANCMGR